jgi:hypothetical protein
MLQYCEEITRHELKGLMHKASPWTYTWVVCTGHGTRRVAGLPGLVCAGCAHRQAAWVTGGTACACRGHSGAHHGAGWRGRAASLVHAGWSSAVVHTGSLHRLQASWCALGCVRGWVGSCIIIFPESKRNEKLLLIYLDSLHSSTGSMTEPNFYNYTDLHVYNTSLALTVWNPPRVHSLIA